MKKQTIWNERDHRWEDESGRRICTFGNETISVVIDNCKEFLEKRDTIYIGDVCLLLEKALEGIKDKSDLSPIEQEDIKRIRNKIKGL